MKRVVGAMALVLLGALVFAGCEDPNSVDGLLNRFQGQYTLVEVAYQNKNIVDFRKNYDATMALATQIRDIYQKETGKIEEPVWSDVDSKVRQMDIYRREAMGW